MRGVFHAFLRRKKALAYVYTMAFSYNILLQHLSTTLHWNILQQHLTMTFYTSQET